MKKQMGNNYYALRKSKLLKDFDKMVKRVRKVFVSHYGESLTDTMVGEARLEYEALIPQMPYVGGKQPFTRFVITTAQFLAVYKALKRHDKTTVEETGRLIYEVCQEIMNSYPKFVLRLVGQINFSKRFLKGLQKRAAESQKRKYPGDYVYTFVEGDGKEFDYGVDYTECAGCKFLKEQGAPELAPYLCPIDILYSEKLGWGLVRTMTLAEGYEKCDFRFKKGGKTKVAVPESMKWLYETKRILAA